MMLRERAVLVAVLGIALAGAAGLAAEQSATQHAKAVQPKKGPAPDQAEAPDPSTQVPAAPQEQFPEPELAAEPPAPPPAAVAPAPAPEPAKEEPPAAPPAQVVQEQPPAPPAVPAKTPEGRKLQQETALLLQLAQDVKTEIQKAGNNTLSLVALRKIDQIQKMSKSLREEMSREQAAPGN